MLDLRTLRRPLLAVTAVALLALLVTVLWFLAEARADLARREAALVEAETRAYVAAWERGRIGDLELMLEQVATSPRKQVGAVQERLRRRDRGVDSVFVWALPPVSPTEGVQLRGTLLFPVRPVSEDTQAVYDHPCLSRGRELSDAGEPSADVAAAYLEDCRTVGDLAVRLRAASEAARFLSEDGAHQMALTALDSVPVNVQGPLSQGLRLGVAPYRLVTHRTQRSEILADLGRREESLELLYRTGLDVLDLDAPALEAGAGQYVRWPILHELDKAGWEQEVERITQKLVKAERRQRAWREIDERILPLQEEPFSEPSRFVFDQYDASRPFLIYYGLSDSGRVGAALHLDQQRLLDMFLGGLRKELRSSVVIRDASGAWQAGPGVGEAPLFEVPFDHTLTHLRVSVGSGVVDERVAMLERQWGWILLIVLVSALVSLAALFALYRATLQQDRMLERQREFTTRVTHELKTPLAGIRLMAENVQLGAYRTPAQLQEMAERIVDESDRLTERVNQILSSARGPAMAKREPFDPEEAVLDAIDTWGPRLEAVGVRLSADLHATEEVTGDLESIRDAVGCLLDNALKYRREGVDSVVELSLTERSNHVLIVVRDNGLGVPPDRRREIFERFVRVEGSHRGPAGGHGLGLAQVAATARAHRGSVTCTEGIDGGACFTLRLPARR